MQTKEQFHNLISCTVPRVAVAALAMAILFALTMVLTQPAQAQTFTVIHTFTGPDGAGPVAGVTLDAAGNLYGTTADGGTVFELKRWHGNWVLNNIFKFNGNNGAWPQSRVVFGPDGALYGTTYEGGSGNAGVVYSLRPPKTNCKTALCPWTETILYQFSGGSDGAHPGYGNVTFDHARNLYGTTTGGGAFGQGIVFRLTPSNGGWTESVLYSFSGGRYGSEPMSGVILDEAGNLYGTTPYGGGGCGIGCGTVYQLTPGGSGWNYSTLFWFGGSYGEHPYGSLIFDQSGNLYGTTSSGGSGGGGTVFELSGGWFYLLYALPGRGNPGPVASPTMDAAGNLYATTYSDGAYGLGAVFKLTPSDGGWIYTSLHDFTNGNDGMHPSGDLAMDVSGNLYGTTYEGGGVWEITP